MQSFGCGCIVRCNCEWCLLVSYANGCANYDVFVTYGLSIMTIIEVCPQIRPTQLFNMDAYIILQTASKQTHPTCTVKMKFIRIPNLVLQKGSL